MTAALRGVALLALFLVAGPWTAPARGSLSGAVQASRKASRPGENPAAIASPASTTVVRDIRRTISGEVIRVTIELESEVLYRTERLDKPPRVLFDLASTRLGPAVAEGTISYSGEAVRRVRVGKHPNQVTRVVLDLTGVRRYSVFTLYSPYRIVVDCERDRGTPGTAIALHAEAAPLPGATPPSTPAHSPAPVAAAPAPTPAALPPVKIVEDKLVPLPPEEIVPEPLYGRPVAAGRSVMPPVMLAPPVLPREVAAAPPRRVTRPEPVPLVLRPLRATRTIAPSRKLLAWQPSVVAPRPIVVAPAPVAATNIAAPLTRAVAVTAAAGREKGERERAAATRTPAPRAAVEKAADSTSDKSTVAKADAPLPRTEEMPITPTLPPAVPSNGFSIARQLGLGAARIVIDPGHGGHDPGAGGSGAFESNIVLDVALRLEKLLAAAGIEAVLTRRSDQYIPLEERTAMANRARGDLFLSIHANASRRRAAGGVETYVLNFASNPEAEAVAARENAATGRTMSQLTDMVKAITLNNKLDESRSFAALVQREMVAHLRSSHEGVRDHGVKQAPFVVLIGASMPSVLVEISFVTNKQEVRLLKTAPYRQKVAQALFDAIRGYQRSLKGTTAITNQ